MSNVVTGFVSKMLRRVYLKFQGLKFSDSESYWNNRYKHGGSSGRGSYGELAAYKAEVLNDFISKHEVKSVIEFGCGDGNQLGLIKCDEYHGFDVSPEAIETCKRLYKRDGNKTFDLVTDYHGTLADLVLSLDVIYHLVEDSVFEKYITRLFSASEKYVIVYSSNTEEQAVQQGPHVKHRKFTHWIEDNIEGWCLAQHVQNRYSQGMNSDEGSIADFFVYAKKWFSDHREVV